jgi:ABC-2 type transport system permease protein/sodium transport system permease protein
MSDMASESPQQPGKRLSGFSWARQWRLTRKELAETLRDRRTIVTLVLMPILVYPLLSVIFRQFVSTSLAGSQPAKSIIVVDDEAFGERLNGWLTQGHRLLAERDEEQSSWIEPPLIEEPAYENIVIAIGDGEKALSAGDADVWVKRLRGDDKRAAGPGIELVYPQPSQAAASLRSFIERRIRAFNLEQRKQQGIPSDQEVGLSVLHQSVATKTASRSLLPSVVPLVLLLMTITGAVYPAIDLTAGERERGTLEALIAAPVSRIGVLMAKYVAVLGVALLTAGMNLMAMSVTIYSAGLSGLLLPPGQNMAVLTLQVLGLLVLFASFFSALLLVVTSFARSFKEAQAYLIPLMIITLAPGVMSLSPTLELNGPLAVVPLVNVVLLARDVFAGGTTPLVALVVVVSTALYAAVSIALAARIFGSDAILYGSGGSWSDLFRRPLVPLSAPSLVGGLLCLAVVFAAMVNLGGAGMMAMAGAETATQLVSNAMITVLIFFGIPLVASIAEHVRVPEAFRTRGASPRFWFAALLLGVSVGLLVFELTVLGLMWEVTSISPQLKVAIAKKAAELNALPVGLVITTLAVVPAAAEELFFRGYLLRTFEQRWGGAVSILATAAAFGLFHTFGVSGLTIERLFPSLLLGLVLGFVARSSGSVWPGMILHALNNALLLLLARYKEALVEQQVLSSDSEHVPAIWLGAAAVMTVIGMALVAFRPVRQGTGDHVGKTP